MKKPCSGETPGLKIEIIHIKLISLFLLLSIEIFPQIPVNGFCKFNRFDVDPGFTSLFALNYNSDSYTDLILFNPAKKEIETVDGEQSGTFSDPNRFKTSVEISHLQGITDKEYNITGYAFSSRKSMKAGIISFGKNGKPSIEQEIKLKSYPDNISIADVEGNGKTSILLSGRSFDGLSLITSVNRKLIENKIVNKSVYSSAQLMDINHDGFPDITAFNLSTLCLDLFYNRGNSSYDKMQSFPFTEQIYSMKTSDIDLDSYEDIIISKRNSVEIIYGNFNSSFGDRKIISTKYNPNIIVTGDFNKDGRIDIAYLDTSSGVLSVLFGKDNREYYPEVIYFKKEGCTNLIPFYSKFINGISVINKNGTVYTITNFTGVSEEISISLGISPQGINYFDHNHDGIPDLCYIDKSGPSLNIIFRNSSGIPDNYYSIPLNETPTDIYVDQFKKNVTFYSYTKGKKLIEVVDLNYYNASYNKKSFYVRNGIMNLRTEHKDDGDVKLYVIQLDKQKLRAAVYNDISSNYINSNFSISDNVMNVEAGKEIHSGLYFWQNNRDSLTLYVASFTNNFQNPEPKYSVRIREINDLLSFTGDLITSKKEAYFAVIRSKESATLVYLSGNSVSATERKDLAVDLPGDESLYYTGAMKFKEPDKIFFVSARDSLLKKIELTNRGRNFSVSSVIELRNPGDYFVKNLNLRNFHLVYINKTENCITIKPLQ